MPAAPAAVSLVWHTARSAVMLDRPVIAAILNVTPDSFWDGGRHAGVEAAVRHAAVLIEAGADMLDVGGESTRPGATPVSAADEMARVIPVVQALHHRWPDVPLSVDTVKAAVAREAFAAGAAAVNDVSGLRLDPGMAEVVARADGGIILMHSRGEVDSMARYDLAGYGTDPVADVIAELEQAAGRARAAGIRHEAIVVDPGLGFAKRTEHSLALLAQLGRLGVLGHPVLIGPSRKRFVGDASRAASPRRDPLRGHAYGRTPPDADAPVPPGTDAPLPPEERLEGTIAACVIGLLGGARIFRVHDVAPVRRALDFAYAVRTSGGAD